MNSTKKLCFLNLCAVLLFLSACGGSSNSSLIENLSVNGESYCDETNQVVSKALEYHLTKSEKDRAEIYHLAMQELSDQAMESLPYYLQYDFSSLIDSMKDEFGRFDSERLNNCQDIAEIQNYFQNALSEYDGELTDERVFFWAFLSNFASKLDYYSAYIPPLGEGDPHEFGLRLDLDLAINYDHTQDSAEVLAVNNPELEIKPGDKVVAIDSEVFEGHEDLEGEYSYESNYSIEQLTQAGLGDLVHRLLFMNPDSDLTLTYIPKGETEEKTLTIEGYVNQGILDNKPLVRAELRGNIGYVRLFEFGSGAAIELASKLHRLKQEWMSNRKPDETTEAFSIILDLRFNPGGSVYELEQIVGLFLPPGRVGVAKVRGSAENEIYDEDISYDEIGMFSESTGIIFEDPMIVLANNRSASAADMLTQALVNTKRAFFVGSSTFGKGIMQYTITLGLVSKLGGALRFTSGRIYGMDGKSVQNSGVQPDLEVEDPLVEKLIRECRRNSTRDCKIQYMKDLPAELQISSDSINELDGSYYDLAKASVQTEFSPAARFKALSSIDELKQTEDERTDIQLKVAEELLESLPEQEE